MTQATKTIWIIIFENSTQWVAARDLKEALSYFNEEGQKKIVKIEKTNNVITYQY